MSTFKLHTIVNDVLQDQGREAREGLCETTHLRRDLGFDSLELAVLSVQIEAAFGVDVFQDGIVTTIGEIEQELARHNTSTKQARGE